MSRTPWVLGSLLVLLLPSWGHAARTLTTDQRLELRLKPEKPTTMVLPEPISQVFHGQDEKYFKVNKDGPFLVIVVGDPAVDTEIHVVSAHGKLYVVHVKVAVPPDDVVYVTTPAPQARAVPFDAFALLRALRTGGRVPSPQAVDVPLPQVTPALVTIESSQAVQVGTLLGVTLTLRNPQPVPLAIDIRVGESAPPEGSQTVALTTWTWPPRLTVKALHSDSDLLAPGGVGQVYVIFERRP
jgi:hypothetical protein